MRRSAVPGLSSIGALLLLGCSGGSGDPPGTAGGAAGLFPGLHPYSTQLHVHGHSNHNGSSQPGSMQWHSAWAQRSGTDVLWWTDHVEMFDLRARDGRCDLTAGTLEPGTLDVVGLGTGIGQVTRLAASVSGGSSGAALRPDGLRMTLRSDPAADWQWLEYEARSDAGTLRGLRWPRPISSGAVLELELVAFPEDPDTRTEIAVELSWHLYGEEVQQELVFRLVPAREPFQQIAIDDDHALVLVPTPRERTLHRLDLLSGASLLRDGADNTLHRITFRVGARRGREAALVLRAFGIHSTAPAPENQLGSVLAHAGRYELAYGVSEHVGAENGNFERPELPHMNAFLPDDLTDLGLLRQPDGVAQLADWVEDVHARGGLVSLNHVFGTSSGFSALLPPDERAARGRSVAAETLATRAFGADLFEVGYLARGGADLRDHLQTWDRLSANGLSLVGVGVSDTHGGAWHAAMQPGSFTTWVLARSTASGDVIEGLRRGRAFFGNGFLWDGTFAFRVGTARMGERALLHADRQPLVLQLDPWPPEVEVYLVQGTLEPGLEVDYLHALTRIERGAELTLDTRRSCFVRLEAWRPTGPSAERFPHGEPIAFTNPVVLLRE